jgi:hypothetical protein
VNRQTTARIVAAIIAAVAWLGLIVQFAVVYQLNSSVLHTLWVLLAYFTITTNLLVAVVFTGITAGSVRCNSSPVVAGTMLYIVLVGVIYGLLLHGMMELSGGSALANVLVHMVTPVLVPLFWICFTPKGKLTWRHPLLWAIYPLAYLGYALVRGGAIGQYPYPFLNVAQIGWPRTAVNSAVIAAAFLLCAYALVWLDRRARPQRF